MRNGRICTAITERHVTVRRSITGGGKPTSFSRNYTSFATTKGPSFSWKRIITWPRISCTFCGCSTRCRVERRNVRFVPGRTFCLWDRTQKRSIIVTMPIKWICCPGSRVVTTWAWPSTAPSGSSSTNAPISFAPLMTTTGTGVCSTWLRSVYRPCRAPARRWRVPTSSFWGRSYSEHREFFTLENGNVLFYSNFMFQKGNL